MNLISNYSTNFEPSESFNETILCPCSVFSSSILCIVFNVKTSYNSLTFLNLNQFILGVLDYCFYIELLF